MYLIGIDCATREEKTGLALYRPGGQLRELRRAAPGESAAGLLSRWISACGNEPFLLCMDAPLGWPASFGRALSRHSAGEPIAAPRDYFFQRAADLCVRRLLGKRPLAMCCAAGLDFQSGAAVPPAMAGVDEQTAEKEGWIWLALPLPESGGEGEERRGHG